MLLLACTPKLGGFYDIDLDVLHLSIKQAIFFFFFNFAEFMKTWLIVYMCHLLLKDTNN